VKRQLLLVAVALAALLTGCAKKKRIAAPPAAPSPAAPFRVGYEEVGLASWYGHPYHGRASSSGEIYDMEKLTAAHRTLPFGAVVEVRNLDNGRTVSVRINDRGPFVDGRIIDLSRAAAREIRMLGPGTAKVRLSVTALPGSIPDGYFAASVPRG
jgi:rare lipoprotein A